MVVGYGLDEGDVKERERFWRNLSRICIEYVMGIDYEWWNI